MKTAHELFAGIAQELISNSIHSSEINAQNVYQEANLKNRPYMSRLVSPLLLPGSKVAKVERLIEFGRLAKQGKSCLILMEHYSNFDIPNFYELMERDSPEARETVNQVISMAGMKLNAESDFVRSCTESYSRIVIFPSRYLDKLREKGEETAAEVASARKINMAALHEMVRRKHHGHIILVFPAGTRYRPGEEETRRGLKEMDSYIRSFDYLMPIAIAGNTLRINMDASLMGEDTIAQDKVVYLCGEILEAAAFHKQARASAQPEEDPKQAVADRIMDQLAKLHEEAEAIRAQS